MELRTAFPMCAPQDAGRPMQVQPSRARRPHAGVRPSDDVQYGEHRRGVVGDRLGRETDPGADHGHRQVGGEELSTWRSRGVRCGSGAVGGLRRTGSPEGPLPGIQTHALYGSNQAAPENPAPTHLCELTRTDVTTASPDPTRFSSASAAIKIAIEHTSCICGSGNSW